MMNLNDQDPMVMPQETKSPSRTYAMSSKIMISAIAILFFVVILMVFLHLYARWYLLRARRRHLRRRNRRATMVFFTAADLSTVTATRGLDPTVIKSLPVFAFSHSTHEEPIECAVCLSEFEETESGRVLPSCKHTFHVDCIDMWFHSHSTCPLCRSLVEPHPVSETPMAAAEEEQVVITISPEPVSETEPGSSSEPRDLGRKPAAIEVPRRNLSEFEHASTQNSPFRSPMSRMLSFTRMLSRDRRNASSPLSPSSRCHIPMIEPDIERGGEQTM